MLAVIISWIKTYVNFNEVIVVMTCKHVKSNWNILVINWNNKNHKNHGSNHM
ncbi:hypothetical protein [Candidatus Hodgkinia cicadicola]|uniref:hypothetical protein n=1 Tax=Candidatus Hodgkinia cicadicola TaxID=573658 RepID=UPI001788D913